MEGLELMWSRLPIIKLNSLSSIVGGGIELSLKNAGKFINVFLYRCHGMGLVGAVLWAGMSFPELSLGLETLVPLFMSDMNPWKAYAPFCIIAI